MTTIETKLQRTMRSIRRQADNGATGRNARLLASIDRYNCLKRKAIEIEAWVDYCESNRLAKDHNGWDCAC